MLEIFTLNADLEIEVTVSDASAVKIICSRNWSSLVKCVLLAQMLCVSFARKRHSFYPL